MPHRTLLTAGVMLLAALLVAPVTAATLTRLAPQATVPADAAAAPSTELALAIEAAPSAGPAPRTEVAPRTEFAPSLETAPSADATLLGTTDPVVASDPVVAAEPGVAATPLDLVGAYDPGTPGVNASVVGHDGYAYIGSWGSANNCPGLGVRIVDLHDPTAPRPLDATAAVYPRTTAEHLAAFHLDTPFYAGNVLLAGIQRCASVGEEGGLAIWDVADPSAPRELSYLPVGRAARGVHEFAVGRQGDRWYAYLAVPNSEVFSGVGDLRIVDITDPWQPVEVTDWGARRDVGLPVGFGEQCAPTCRGSTPQAFLHSVALSPDGRTAYLSYWDLGVVILDVSDPASPRFLGRFAEPARAEGNAHSVSVTRDGALALVADETFAPPWGRLRLVDVRDAASPVQVGAYDSPNSAAETPSPPVSYEVWYTIHNPLADDRDPTRAYLAWYADGVRLIDVADPSAPVELASWVPPQKPMVWSVAFYGDYLLVGDVYNGLYVLQR